MNSVIRHKKGKKKDDDDEGKEEGKGIRAKST